MSKKGDILIKGGYNTLHTPLVDYHTHSEVVSPDVVGKFCYLSDYCFRYIRPNGVNELVYRQPDGKLPLLPFSKGYDDTKVGWQNGTLAGVYGDGVSTLNLDLGDANAWTDETRHDLKSFYADRNTNQLYLGFVIKQMFQLNTIKAGYLPMVYFDTAKTVVVFDDTVNYDGLFATAFTAFHLFEITTNVKLGFVPAYNPLVGVLSCGKKGYAGETLWGWVDTGRIDDAVPDEPLYLPESNARVFTDNVSVPFNRVYVSLKDGKYTLQIRFDGNIPGVKSGRGIKVEAFSKAWTLNTLTKQSDGLTLNISAADYNLWAGLGRTTNIKIGTV